MFPTQCHFSFQCFIRSIWLCKWCNIKWVQERFLIVYKEYEESVAWLQPMLALIRWDIHYQQMIQPGKKFKLLYIYRYRRSYPKFSSYDTGYKRRTKVFEVNFKDPKTYNTGKDLDVDDWLESSSIHYSCLNLWLVCSYSHN